MAVDRIKLSEFFGLVKRPKYVLGTTYTLSLAFFESVVLPHVNRDELQSCLIISDQVGYTRALSEGAALQGAAQDYLVMSAPTEGPFHAKVWLVVGEKEVALLVGSGNLTQSGFIDNAELFDALHYTFEFPPSPAIIDDLTSFLDGLSTMWTEQDKRHLLCGEVLAQMRDALSGFKRRDAIGLPDVRFLHTFEGPLIDQLPELPHCRDVFMAAPYFGGRTAGIELLAGKYSGSRFHIFPAVHGGTTMDLPVDVVRKDFSPATLVPLKVAGKGNAFVHLKLYGFNTDNSASWLFCTSANCTAAAWKGQNVEAGLLRKVKQEVLKDYFVAGKGGLPNDELTRDRDPDVLARLPLWSVDTGGGLDVILPASWQERVPFSDAVLIVRFGSHIARCERGSLFENGVRAHLLWESFCNWQRRRNTSVSLELSAVDKMGKAVQGACFVENRMLLTAEPVHRSAFRGALAMLEVESFPELADVSAIFRLAESIFSGQFKSGSKKIAESEEMPAHGKAEEEGEEVRPVAVWPPQADETGIRKQLGTTGLGHLHWCQRILQTFLSPAREHCSEKQKASSPYRDDGADADQQDPIQLQREQEEAQKQTDRVAKQIWKIACNDFESLCRRLNCLVPTEEMAKNLWPGAIFVFLATASVHRVIRKSGSDFKPHISAEKLGEEFLRYMLNERHQSPDYCCPAGLRYRHTPFPALADDLRRTFGVLPHPDFAPVLLALVTSYRMRAHQTRRHPMTGSTYVKQVLPPDLSLDSDAKESCLEIWRYYLREQLSQHVDADFITTLNELLELREQDL